MKMNLSNGNPYEPELSNQFIGNRKLKNEEVAFKDLSNVILINSDFNLITCMPAYLKSIVGTTYNQKYRDVKVSIIPSNSNIDISYFIKSSYLDDTLYYFVMSISPKEFRYLAESMKFLNALFFDCNIQFTAIQGLKSTEIYDPLTHKALNDKRVMDYKKLGLSDLSYPYDPNVINNINKFYTF